MNGEIILLIVSAVISFALAFIVISKKCSQAVAFFLWLIQLITVVCINMFMLNLGVIDTFTSAYGLITILMLILVLANQKLKKT